MLLSRSATQSSAPVVATADYNFLVFYNMDYSGAMRAFGNIVGELPPAAPSVKSATDMMKDSFTANWGAGEEANGYRLDVSTTNTFASYLPGYQNLDVGNVTSKQVTGLNNNTTYYYRVRAYNTWGVGPNSVVGAAITALNTVVIKSESDMMIQRPLDPDRTEQLRLCGDGESEPDEPHARELHPHLGDGKGLE